MNATQTAKLKTLNKVRDFFDGQPTLLPEGVRGYHLLTAIREICAQLDEEEHSQYHHIHKAQTLTLEKSRIRRNLETLLRQIVRAVPFVERTVPSVHGQFQFTRGVADSRLLYIAKQFWSRAEPFSEDFAEFAVPVAELPLLIKQLEAELHERSTSRSAHKDATLNINDALKHAFDILAQLHVVMVNTLRKDVSTLRDWEKTRRVRVPAKRKPRKAKEPAADGAVAAKPARKKRRRKLS